MAPREVESRTGAAGALIAPHESADTVGWMTKRTDRAPRPCPTCKHDHDQHVLLMVLNFPAPMGIMLCPQCPCSSTWRANTTASTRDQVNETRRLVTERLLQDGYPLPECLR